MCELLERIMREVKTEMRLESIERDIELLEARSRELLDISADLEKRVTKIEKAIGEIDGY